MTLPSSYLISDSLIEDYTNCYYSSSTENSTSSTISASTSGSVEDEVTEVTEETETTNLSNLMASYIHESSKCLQDQDANSVSIIRVVKPIDMAEQHIKSQLQSINSKTKQCPVYAISNLSHLTTVQIKGLIERLHAQNYYTYIWIREESEKNQGFNLLDFIIQHFVVNLCRSQFESEYTETYGNSGKYIYVSAIRFCSPSLSDDKKYRYLEDWSKISITGKDFLEAIDHDQKCSFENQLTPRQENLEFRQFHQESEKLLGSF